MAREIKYAELSQNQLDFLREYAPKDKGFTSSLEMKKIISKFGLDEGIGVEDMRAILNSYVLFLVFCILLLIKSGRNYKFLMLFQTCLINI